MKSKERYAATVEVAKYALKHMTLGNRDAWGRRGHTCAKFKEWHSHSRLVLRVAKLECVPVITSGREELAYSSARVYVVRRVARHKKKAFALISAVAVNEVVDLLERAYTYWRHRENARKIWPGESRWRVCGFCSWNSKARIHTWTNNNGMILQGLRDPTRGREACRGIVVTAFPVLRYPARGLTIVRLARRFGGDRVRKAASYYFGH